MNNPIVSCCSGINFDMESEKTNDS